MNAKIALGLNNGVDYEIRWDSSVIEKMIIEKGMKASDIRKLSIIDSDWDLLSSILYYVSTGEGASAYVSDIKINFDFASKFDYKVTIGGAGTRAAIAIDKLGYGSIVHLVSTNNETRTKCNVLLIGGFTTIPNPKDGLAKAEEVLGYIRKYVGPGTEVYYEDSCPPRGISEGHTAIWRTVASNISIFGLNEDELQNHIGRKINLLDANDVIKALQDLERLIPCKNYVLHTKYYALAYGENAKRYRDSLVSGIALATTRLVHGDYYGSNEVKEIMARPADPNGRQFSEIMDKLDNGIIALPSFLVTEKNVTTIGLGDAFVGGFLAKLSEHEC